MGLITIFIIRDEIKIFFKSLTKKKIEEIEFITH